MVILILGCDGYIGNALTQKLLVEGHTVYGVDNLLRRDWVEDVMGSYSAIDILSMEEKTEHFSSIGDFTYFYCDIASNHFVLDRIIRQSKPDTIINLAHIPSGPYSQISRDTANKTITNNCIGTNNVLWLMKQYCPDCHYITIGTTGEYDHYSNIDIEEGYININHNGRESNEMIYPRRPGSIYHCCYDKETEVLTDDGWKNFKELLYTDKVATLNKDNDTLEFQIPSNIMEYDYKGDLIGIRNKNTDLLVTPNHKIFEHSNRNTPLYKWRLTEAENVFEKNMSMKRNVNNWNGEEAEFFVLPSCNVKTSAFSYKKESDKTIKIEDWVRFFGWYITEGSLYKNNVVISQSKKSNFNEITNSLKKLNLDRKIQTNRQNKKIKGFSIKCSQLSQYLIQFGLSHEKYIPKFIKNLSKENLSILIEVMLKGDGHINKKSNKFNANFFTKSKRLADDFQEIAIKCGYSTIIYTPTRSKNEYVVRLSETNTSQFIMSKSVNEQRKKPIYYKTYYNDKVYCCEVPNSIILVRRKGKVIWSGNSKTASTYLIDFLARSWNIKCTDVQQSVVFGAYTDEIDETNIYSRFDSDEAGGTVVNRFIIQALLGVPLTVYGEGKHKRGFISLNDSIQALNLAVNNPAEAGKVQVWNQLSDWYSMNEIAEMVKDVVGDVNIQHIDTPRNEHTGDHYYKYITEKLSKLGYKPTRTIKNEIKYVYDLLQPRKKHLEGLKDVVMPKITWG